MIIKILVVLGVTALGMTGGQCKKWTRRYVLPSLASAFTFFKRKKARYKGLYLLSLCGVLSMGYGESSTIRTFWKRFVDEPWADRLTRITIGLLLSIPFLFLGKWYASIVFPIAFSIRAGGFKITKTKDWLWEDFIRYGSLGILVVI